MIRKFTADQYAVYKWLGRKFTADQYAVYKWLGRKFAADQYAGYKWLGRKFSPLSIWQRTFFVFRSVEMKRAGFYLIKDEFFEDMQEEYLKGNKQGNRPHYYCVEDDIGGLYWMIPLSSKISKYKNIMTKLEKSHKACNALHIIKLSNDRESVFLIQDMFPITEKYVEREYTIGGIHFVLSREKDVEEIEKKARIVIKMLRQGIKFTPTQPNVMAILEKLKIE